MKLAANYSAATAGLVQSGQVALDYIKCPAWPGLALRAQAIRPVYVHFPLQVGWGGGDALDAEAGGPPDWDRVERLLAQTGTPYVNLHLTSCVADWPAIPADTTEAAHVEIVAQALIRDVQAVCHRFGPERVVVENDYYNAGWHLRPAFSPSVIARVVGETGCGLLLDLAHARISASELAVADRDYSGAVGSPGRPCRPETGLGAGGGDLVCGKLASLPKGCYNPPYRSNRIDGWASA